MRIIMSSQLSRSGRSSDVPTVQRSLETTLVGSQSTASTWCQATTYAKNPTHLLEMFVFLDKLVVLEGKPKDILVLTILV